MVAGTEPGGTSWDVFIAYASADREPATELWRRLNDQGLRCFIDHECLQPGDAWDVTLSDALDASDVIVIVVSASTDRNAFYVLEEIAIAIDAARRRNARVVPVYLGDEVDPPYGLRRLHSLRVSDGWDHVERRLAALFERDDDGRTADDRRIWGKHIPRWDRNWQTRDHLIQKLDETTGVSTLGQAAEAFAVSGAGGIGKTTLAAMYAHTRRDRFDLIWWVRSESDVLLTQDLAEMAGPLGVAATDSIEETAAIVRDELGHRSEPWLVVFDNARNADALEPWLPEGSAGRVIITSRSTEWDGVAELLDVPLMPPDEASRFLTDRVRSRNEAAADETEAIAALVDHLRGFPLALEHAGAYVARNASKRFSDYLDRYRTGGFADDPKFATWKISFDEAVGQQSLCGAVMRRLAFCAPDAVPELLLVDLAESAGALDDALDVLDAVSLLRRGDGVVDLHRLVQDAARRDATVDDLNGLLESLKSAFPDTDDPEQRERCEALAPHVLAAAEHAKLDGVDGTTLWWVVDDVVNHLRSAGQPAASVPLAEQAVELAESLPGISEANTLTSRNNLAGSYWSVGRVDDAIQLGEQVLADRVEVLGDRHPDTLLSRSNLASSYWSVGRFDDAIQLEERVLADRVEVLGDRHPDTLTSRNNLASSYRSVGRFDDAIQLFEQVLADLVEVLGDRHPNTLLSRGNLAGSYWSVGRVDDALQLEEQVLADLVEVLGDRHPNTLTSRNNLALSYWSVGRLDDAIQLLRLAIEQAEQLDHEHPHLASWRTTLNDWTNS